LEKETKKIGTITLAISLIGIGLIFLLGNFFDLSPYKDPGLLWPAILIIFGMELIITKAVYSKKGNTVKLSVDVLSLILIIIIILVSVAVNIATNIRLPFIDFDSGGIRFGTNIENFRYKTNTTFNSGPIDIDDIADGKIIINNYLGNINIINSNNSSLLVEANIEVHSNDRNLAKDYLEKAIEINTQENIEISTQLPDNRNIISEPVVDYTIHVPQGCYTVITNGIGNINAEGLSNTLQINNNDGKIVVGSINGNIDIKNSFGAAEASNIQGTISINNNDGSIDVGEIYGDAYLETSFGSITAENVSGCLTAKSSNGSIKATNIKGETDLKTNFGSITMENLSKKISASTSDGSIKLDNTSDLEDDVSLSTGFGSIQISCPPINNATIKASTGFGSIESEGLLEIDKKGDSYTGKAVLGNGSKRINLTTGDGSITINKK
jgi:hypothetical protein